jgi:hypothetical protein
MFTEALIRLDLIVLLLAADACSIVSFGRAETRPICSHAKFGALGQSVFADKFEGQHAGARVGIQRSQLRKFQPN